mmetsp:Transcript_12105/g.29194  ORF Transcript_12105/g.29194 Transcript_12105/m.29194 type:complete len:81 (-) Transcript_12105:364-606(-)
MVLDGVFVARLGGGRAWQAGRQAGREGHGQSDDEMRGTNGMHMELGWIGYTRPCDYVHPPGPNTDQDSLQYCTTQNSKHV